jgi:hypothetical protein
LVDIKMKVKLLGPVEAQQTAGHRVILMDVHTTSSVHIYCNVIGDPTGDHLRL